MCKARRRGSDSIVDAATIAVAAHGAVGVPALAAGLRGAANAKPLAAVSICETSQDLLGGELGDLICDAQKDDIRSTDRRSENLICICSSSAAAQYRQ